MNPIPLQANIRTRPLVKRADGVPITAGTVNYYLIANTGANAGKWFKTSDNSWDVAEQIAAVLSHKADGVWSGSVDAEAWPTSGVEYTEYAKEDGDLHVPTSKMIRCEYAATVIAPGVAGGLFIAGSNAATTFASLTVTAATTLTGAVSLGSTLGVTGVTTFNSIVVTGAATGISVTGTTQGVLIQGGTTGKGLVIEGGSTSGYGTEITSTSGAALVVTATSGAAVDITASAGIGIDIGASTSGITVDCGAGAALHLAGTTYGMELTASAGPGLSCVSTGGDGDGIVATKHGTGYDINGTLTVCTTNTDMVGTTQIAAAVWDRVLSGATHNIATSAGRRLRQLEDVLVVDEGTAQGAGGGNDTIQLAAGADGNNNWYQYCWVILTGGTGSDQLRHIMSYVGATQTATLDRDWITNPDATSTYTIIGQTTTMVHEIDSDGLAQINTECDAAILAYIQLLARSDAAIATDNATELTAINADGGSGAGDYDNTSESVEAIRDRGDAEWITGAGGAPPNLLQSTTIATLATQTSFTLTAGSADDDAYNNAYAVVTDSVTAEQKAVCEIADYTGGTLTVTLASDPGIFTMAAGDGIKIVSSGGKSVADALGDELLADHTTAGTFGAALGKANQIGTSTITISSPVATDGDITLHQYDDYDADETRSLEWTNSDGDWGPDDITDATVEFVIRDQNGVVKLTADGVVVTPTTTQKVRVELTNLETADLDYATTYEYQLRLILDTTERQETIAVGNVTVTTSGFES